MARKINKSSQLTLLSIHSDYLEYSDSSGSSKIKFTPEVVDHLEIIDSVKLDQLIISFISRQQLIKNKLIFVLDRGVYFEKKISDINDDLTVQNFINKIPFDDVAYKIIPDKSSFRLIAFNHDFLETLKKFFEANGFEVISTIPKFDLDNTGFNFDKSKKEINAALKILKTDNLLSNNHYLLPANKFNIKNFTSILDSFKKIKFSKISNTIKLVFVFISLIIVLVILFFIKKPVFNFKSFAPTPTPIVPTSTPTPIPIIAETVSLVILIFLILPTIKQILIQEPLPKLKLLITVKSLWPMVSEPKPNGVLLNFPKTVAEMKLQLIYPMVRLWPWLL